MRQLRVAAPLACVVALGGATVASGDSTAPKRPRPVTTVTLFAPIAQLALVDLGDSGFSLGDESVFSDDLLTRRNGRNVGYDGGVCTVVRVADAATQSGRLQCRVTYSLPHGQIATDGLVPVAHGALAGTQVAAITGGTGRYRHAAGEAAVTFLRPGEASIRLSIRR